MKKSCFILALSLLFFSNVINAQIEKVIVETYYISDTLDATDTTDFRTLDAGSKTYRVYIDMKPGYKLKTIYGDTAHKLKIASTAKFFNNIDRPTEWYGYLINKQYFHSNPTLALDSWLTIGKATTQYNGILKTQDTGLSIIGGTHNGGGSSSIPGGILVNNDPAAGIPLTSQDGLSLNNYTYGQWNENGFKNQSGVDTTIFGSLDSLGTQFISNNAQLQQVSGVIGPIPDSNQVLVAQLTTKGNLSFELNIELLDSVGNSLFFVSKSNYTLPANTFLCPFLVYPPLCGCRDTRYLEYDPNYACNDSTQCHTLKIFGCTDTMACNYNPDANMLLPNFCCYPGYCNDRDISLVCPNLPLRLMKPATSTDVYPNPVQDVLALQLYASTDDREVSYVIYDSFDRVVVEQNLGTIPGNSVVRADVSDLPKGLYLFRVTVSGSSSIKKFIKN